MFELAGVIAALFVGSGVFVTFLDPDGDKDESDDDFDFAGGDFAGGDNETGEYLDIITDVIDPQGSETEYEDNEYAGDDAESANEEPVFITVADSDISEIGGTSDNDELKGGATDDFIYGFSGDDTLIGDAGEDALHGGSGDDVLRGDGGADALFGGAGDDRLFGGSGSDNLIGGNGNDQLSGGSGDDSISGNAGDDRLIGGAGQDHLNGGFGNDVVIGVNVDAETSNITDDKMADFLNGAHGDDTIIAGNDDIISMGQGKDLLVLGDWIDDEHAAEVMDFVPGEDQLMVLYNEDETLEPTVEFVSDTQKNDTHYMMVDGVCLSVIHSEIVPDSSSVILMPQSQFTP